MAGITASHLMMVEGCGSYLMIVEGCGSYLMIVEGCGNYYSVTSHDSGGVWQLLLRHIT